jgi:hypothetical protein
MELVFINCKCCEYWVQGDVTVVKRAHTFVTGQSYTLGIENFDIFWINRYKGITSAIKLK